MPFSYTTDEVLETIRMVEIENLDIRTITIGSVCVMCDGSEQREKEYKKIVRTTGNLVVWGGIGPFRIDYQQQVAVTIVNC